MSQVIPDANLRSRIKMFTNKLSAEESEFIREQIKLLAKTCITKARSSEEEETIFIDRIVMTGLSIVDHSEAQTPFNIDSRFKALIKRATRPRGAELIHMQKELSSFYDEDEVELGWLQLKCMLISLVLEFNCDSNKEFPF